MSSYLLIGFWYDAMVPPTRPEGLVVNRVGDFGLLLGISGLFWATGKLRASRTSAFRLSQALADGKRLSTGGGDPLPVWCSWGDGPNRPSSPTSCLVGPTPWRGPTPISP